MIGLKMKKLFRPLFLSVFLLSMTPTVQAWSFSSVWDSVTSFFSNDTDSTGLKIAKYGIPSLFILGTAAYIYKFFTTSSSTKKPQNQTAGRAPHPNLARKNDLSPRFSTKPKAKTDSPLSISAPPLTDAQKKENLQKVLEQLKSDAGRDKKNQEDKRLISLSGLQKICSCFAERTQQYLPSAITTEEFETILNRYLALMDKLLGDTSQWLNFDQKLKQEFTPFVQKLIVPNGSEIAMWGDLHGSVHSLLRTLIKLRDKNYIDDNFNIIKDNFYMFFLGDYVDRGAYGVEVIYILLRLKLANPDKVILVRGNHEDLNINFPQPPIKFGSFSAELTNKFGDKSKSQWDKSNIDYLEFVAKIYETMPLALFLGRPLSPDFIQCCHGGIEHGYNPEPMLNSKEALKLEWINTLTRKDWLQKIDHKRRKEITDGNIFSKSFTNFSPECASSIDSTLTVGFMWNDFNCGKNDLYILKVEDRGHLFGQTATHDYLYKTWLAQSPNKICRIMRAHQHNDNYDTGPMLTHLITGNGMHSLWDGQVYTLLSAPASGCDSFSCDAFAMVTAQDQWPIKLESTPIPQGR